MPWNAAWPVAGISVKANRLIGNNNMLYIETTMGDDIVGTNTNITRDHFWNVGGNEDGRHRFINSPAFTVGGVPFDPVVGAGMDAVLYLKTTNAQPQWFNRTASGIIYQATPNFLQGTVVLNTANMVNIIAIPANVYGEIFLFTTASGRESGQAGFFRSSGAVCDAFSYGERLQGAGTARYPVRMGNGTDAAGLNIRAQADEAATGLTWNYRITYRAI